jgi:transposase InsO family protein
MGLNTASPPVNSRPLAVKHLLLELPQIPRSRICKVLGVSRPHSYKESKLDKKDELLANLIIQIRTDNPYYGIVRLKQALRLEFNQNHNQKKLRKVCNRYNLKAKPYTNNWVKSKDKGLADTQIPNLLKDLLIRDTDRNNKVHKINQPNQVWCSDFTYLKFQGYCYYLATTIDVYTKEITGYHLSTKHDTNLVLTTLQKAIRAYGLPQIIHSDQGSEYRSGEYQEYLKANQIQPSNSAKSSPWENGYQESFYGKFKPELEIQHLPYGSTFLDLHNYIANQVDYYNTKRIHTAILDIPASYRQKYNTQTTNQTTSHFQKQTTAKTPLKLLF